MRERAWILPVVMALAAAVTGSVSPAAASGVDLLFGVERSQGQFLGDDAVALDDLWIQGEFGRGGTRLVVRVPWVRLDRTGLITFGPDAPIVVGAGGPGSPARQKSPAAESENGLGDVLVRSETYIMKAGHGKQPSLAFIADYKWSTADADKGLGTGEDDWGLGLDYVQPLSKAVQILGVVSYRFMGSPEGVNFDDRLRIQAGVGFVTAHAVWRLVAENVTPPLGEVPRYDTTGAVVGVADVQDYRVVRGEFVYRSGAGGSTRLFVLAGLNDSSPDLGFGLSFASRVQ